MSWMTKVPWGAIDRALGVPDYAWDYYEAFVPDPIFPLNPSFSAGAIGKLAKAERANGRWQEELRKRPALRSVALATEALGSSRIENISGSYQEIVTARLKKQKTERERLLLGNEAASDLALAVGKEGRVGTVELFRMHRELLKDSLEEGHIAGKLREGAVWIGGDSPASAMFVPPPRNMLEGLLDDLSAYIARDDLAPVVQAALAHGQYETIHPHEDGNGRAGRALILAVLAKYGVADGVTPISAALFNRRSKYYQGFTEFREGEYEKWSVFIGEALEEASFAMLTLAEEVSTVETSWQERMKGVRKDAASWKIMEGLTAQPVVDFKEAKRLAPEHSSEAVRTGLKQLVLKLILQEKKVAGSHNLWVAPEMIDVSERTLGEFGLGKSRQLG